MRRLKSYAVVVALMMIIAACGGSGGSDETTTTSGETGTTEDQGAGATSTTEDSDGSSGDKTTVRWYVGLGAGGQPEQEAVQREVVDEFNASQDEIELVLEIVENDVAYETLATQIASGNAPDIIGPVGRDGSNEYAGQYLDLEPLVEQTGVATDMWAGAAIDNQRESDGTLVGLPFASYPSAIYFSRDLFDEAELPYPPQEYGPDGVATYGEGTEYEGTWDYDKVAEIAQILTPPTRRSTAPTRCSGDSISSGPPPSTRAAPTLAPDTRWQMMERLTSRNRGRSHGTGGTTPSGISVSRRARSSWTPLATTCCRRRIWPWPALTSGTRAASPTRTTACPVTSGTWR